MSSEYEALLDAIQDAMKDLNISPRDRVQTFIEALQEAIDEEDEDDE